MVIAPGPTYPVLYFRYYFPTFENDNLLSGLHCDDNSPPADDWVIPEDSPNLTTLTDGLVSPIVEVGKDYTLHS